MTTNFPGETKLANDAAHQPTVQDAIAAIRYYERKINHHRWAISCLRSGLRSNDSGYDSPHIDAELSTIGVYGDIKRDWEDYLLSLRPRRKSAAQGQEASDLISDYRAKKGE